VTQQEKQLIGSYPNTYTYTKSMAERSLFKKRGNLNCVLFRPSIIAASLSEPFPGWTDSLAAAGGLTLMSSLGLIKYIKVYKGGNNSFDVIPVDIVSNGILVTTANAGCKNEKTLDIYNCGTSGQNPISMIGYANCVKKANKSFSFNKKVFPVKTEMITNPTEYKVKKMIF
jgi:alcohol-forming fatty acyl-CoA reductase